jgi:hypothetical protein
MGSDITYDWPTEDETGGDVFGHSRFLKWLAGENAAGRVRFRRLKAKSGRTVLDVILSMATARRFAIGHVNGVPFLGVQPGDLAALAEIPWTHSEARRGFASASITLCGRAPNDLPIRVSIPANLNSFRLFMRQGARSIHIRRVVVAPHGRVSRVSRKPWRALRLVRRAQIRRNTVMDGEVTQQGAVAMEAVPGRASVAAQPRGERKARKGRMSRLRGKRGS